MTEKGIAPARFFIPQRLPQNTNREAIARARVLEMGGFVEHLRREEVEALIGS